MAWKKKTKDLDEEFEDEYEDEYDQEEYDDDYQDEKYDDNGYDDDYDDDYDDYEEEKRRNPLKGVVVVLLLLTLILAAATALLYLRLQTAESKVNKLNTALTTAQTELSRMQAEAAAATPAPAATPEPTPVPETTPAPELTPEPEATPEPTPVPETTPEPTPEAPAAPKDTTKEMLAGVLRPDDECWLPEAKTAFANSYMVASHWGPGLDWTENLVLYQNDQVEILAVYKNWSLIHTKNDQYGWVVSTLLTEGTPKT